MTEPIPLPRISAALNELVQVLHQDTPDPVARVLIPADRRHEPTFVIHASGISMRYSSQLPAATEVAAAALAFFGGDVTLDTSYSGKTETHELHTAWLGVPLVVYVPVPREDVVAALRKELAELRATAAAAGAGVSE